jgi:hypothetical protein
MGEADTAILSEKGKEGETMSSAPASPNVRNDLPAAPNIRPLRKYSQRILFDYGYFILNQYLFKVDRFAEN